MRQILQRTVSKPSTVIAAIGEPSAAPVFSTWHTSTELTVLHVVWPPTVELMPHDHMMWASIGLYGGREDNRFFRVLPDGRLENRGGTTLLGGDTVLLGADTIHAVANPRRRGRAQSTCTAATTSDPDVGSGSTMAARSSSMRPG